MPRIAIVTDSDASIPADIAARYGIPQVPITVHFGSEILETNADIDDAGAFARIERDGKLPTTAAPAPGKFAAAFQAAFDVGAEQVICFCVSGEVSATYGSALAGREMLPDRDITVVDSRTLTMAQGFMVLAAADAAAAGASKGEVIAAALDIRERTYVYAALPTLKYLAMSGRVSHLTAGFAGLLDVKPILTIRDGKLDMLERVRSRAKSWARLIELTRLAAAGRPVERMAIVHICARQDALAFETQLRAAVPCPKDILIAEMTPGMSVHGGAGMVTAISVIGK
jgi:DegV family protein with EDD domain